MSKQGVMVIGLDGATFDLMRPWLAQGKLPTMAQLIAEGAAGEMNSVPNMNSAAAWCSFATGLNPGKHGVYWLVEYMPNSYELRPTSARLRHGETIWARLSRQGRRVAVLNVPITWPAEPVNGILVAGWDCPSVYSRGFTHPPEFAQELLRACDGEFIIKAARESPNATIDEILGEIHAQTASHLKAARHVLSKGPWDLFVVVFTATDMVHHLLWKTIDPRHPDYDPREAARHGEGIYNVYKQLDDAIAELLAYVGDDTTVIVMSDHGAGICGGDVHSINQWLSREGFLVYHTGTSQNGKQDVGRHVWREMRRNAMRLIATTIWKVRSWRLLSNSHKQRIKAWMPWLRTIRMKAEMQAYTSQIDWSRTVAYGNNASDFIRINLKGREPEGSVSPEDYEAVRDQIIARLYEWRDPTTGKPLVAKVWKREEIYHGPYVNRAADLEIRWTDVVPRRPENGSRPRQFFDQISGGHKPNGILIMRGPGIAPGSTIEGAELVDMAPTILYLLGEPVPTIMDGKVLVQAVRSDYLVEHPLIYTDQIELAYGHDGNGAKPDQREALTAAHESEDVYSEEETVAVEERLRDLGYLA